MTEPAIWTLVLHGGAGMMTRDRIDAETDMGARAGLSAALDAGSAILANKGSALDAVEAAVRVLEDDPHFNAGRGAALSHEGVAELDAAIMDGRDRAAGAVAGVTGTRNPVSLARAVMTESRHVLLGGEGADQFSREHGLEQADQDWFVLPERRRQLEELKARGADSFDVDMKYGTVGAVARDGQGHVAAATSTGGVTGKRWGRIGDSPLIGAGTYADDRSCAVSATGHGEVFIRAAVAHDICSRMRFGGRTLEAAVREVVLGELPALHGEGGVIAIDRHGEIAMEFNSEGMFRASRRAGEEALIAIYRP